MKGLKILCCMGLILGATGCTSMGGYQTPGSVTQGQGYANPGYAQQVREYDESQGYYQHGLTYYHRLPDYYCRQLCKPYYQVTCNCQQQCCCPPPC